VFFLRGGSAIKSVTEIDSDAGGGVWFSNVYKKREDRYVYLSLPLNQLTKSKFYEKIHYKDEEYFGGCNS